MLGLAFLGACSLQGLSDGHLPITNDDASTIDGPVSPTEDASFDGVAPTDAAAPASPSFIPNGDFEMESASCEPWDLADGGTATRVTPGHESAHACRVCMTPGAPKLGLYVNLPRSPMVGTHRIRGYLRIASGSPSGEFRLDTDYEDASGNYVGEFGATGPQTTEWQHFEKIAEVPAGNYFRRAYVSTVALPAEDVCFDFDDVTLSKVGP